jgi:hypothetical protein
MSVAGNWNIRIATPIGDQKGVATIVPDGAGRFTGTISGDVGSMNIAGEAQGDHLTWTMKIAKPMPLDLECEADAQGDALTGALKAGFLGSFKLSGTRV